MKTNRRSFLGSGIALAAVSLTAPLTTIASISTKPTPITDDLSWAFFLWDGDVDAALNFGNSGPCPLWGDDFRIDLETNCVEFLSFKKDCSCVRESAKLNEIILRSPEGYFYRLPLAVQTKWFLGEYP